MRSIRLLFRLSACLLQLSSLAWAAERGGDYTVVVSGVTYRDPAWREVVTTLISTHHASVVSYTGAVETVLGELQVRFPRYVCFVAQPSEASRSFVAQVHRLTRSLDEDPYPDCFWGILTGYDAANALRIAQCQKPLAIRRLAAGTEIPLELAEEGQWYSELKAGLQVIKEKGGNPVTNQVPADTTKALAATLTEFRADLFLTSGHATERDWQIGYKYRNGYFRCAEGVLYGEDTTGLKHRILSPNPKVYLPIGNCLMGHIDGTNAMALAFMNSAGVLQMMGYTVNTWYGYAGWGCLDYFIEQPGRYTFVEAFLANQVALMHRLQTFFPDQASAQLDDRGRLPQPVSVSTAAREAGLNAQDAVGLAYDRDTVAFYGDPGWVARIADGPLGWDQKLSRKGTEWIFEITPRRGENSFQPLSFNGSQRGGRPFVQFFNDRLKNIEVVSGQELKPVVTDTFLLVPNPGKIESSRSYKVVFRGTIAQP